MLEKEAIKLSAINQFKITALEEIVLGKLARRNVSLKNIERKDADISPLGHARQELKLKQGLETDIAKTICQAIRDTKLKVRRRSRTGRSASPARTATICRRSSPSCAARNFPSRSTTPISAREPLAGQIGAGSLFLRPVPARTRRPPGPACANYTGAQFPRGDGQGRRGLLLSQRQRKGGGRHWPRCKTAYPDPTVEPGEKADWFCVDLKAGAALPKPVTLDAVKAHPPCAACSS